MQCLGDVDELSSALGLVRRSLEPTNGLQPALERIQLQLISLMGQVGVHPEDWPRYQSQNFGQILPEDVETLTAEAAACEATLPRFTDWVLPGARGPMAAAALDFARTVCRRAERSLLVLEQSYLALGIVYLNRLSDWLWLQARVLEHTPAKA
jgi:cob(I)alamin adenosyltransferase